MAPRLAFDRLSMTLDLTPEMCPSIQFVSISCMLEWMLGKILIRGDFRSHFCTFGTLSEHIMSH
jgi:hypothetical protein